MDEGFSTENDVLIGRDGELFLASGGHRSLEYATGQIKIDPAKLNILHTNICERAAFAQKTGTPFVHVVFPDKQSVVSSRYLIKQPVCLGEEYLAAHGVEPSLFYPIELLRNSPRPAFLKTDTHLSDYGSITVVGAVFERLTGLSAEMHTQRLLSLLTVTRDHLGDLGSKLAPPQQSEELFAQTSWPKVHYHNDIGGGNNGAVSIFVTPGSITAKRLVWFGDSFGREAVRFLSYYFREILFLRTPFFHPEFVELMKPDFIVSENVERYIASCQPDDQRPNFFMFPFLSGRTVQADRKFAEAFSGITSFPRKPYRDFIKAAYASLSISVSKDSKMELSKTGITVLESSISLPNASVMKAAEMNIPANIHPNDFIFQFVKRRWKDDTAAAVNNYYNLGKYCTGLLYSVLEEVKSVKKFTERDGESWKPERILDFASGYGCSSRHMKNAFIDSRVTTCDIHEAAVEFNKAIIGLDSVLSSPLPEKLSVPMQDVIVAMSFFSHMPEATYGRWLEALAAHLAPGGVLVFTANGFVTEKRGSTGVTAGPNGFGFHSVSDQLDLDGGDYGTTISYPKWVFPIIEKISGMRLAKFQEGHWWAIQDTYVCIKAFE